MSSAACFRDPYLIKSVVHSSQLLSPFRVSGEALSLDLRTNRSGQVLFGVINDSSALGAWQAFQEARRSDECAVMGQNASTEARIELRSPGNRPIRSVAFFPEKHGEQLIGCLPTFWNHRPVPPAVFVKHQLIAAVCLDHFYPND